MTLRRFLKRLRLKRGDILLVEREEYAYDPIEKIMELGRAADIKFNVPIVFHDRKHAIERLPFKDLEKIYLEAKKAHDRRKET